MQENKKIAILAPFSGLSVFSIVNKFLNIIFISALLNYLFFVSLQIVRNLVFNILFFSSANTQKTTKGAIYSALSYLKNIIIC